MATLEIETVSPIKLAEILQSLTDRVSALESEVESLKSEDNKPIIKMEGVRTRLIQQQRGKINERRIQQS
jgi:hypothetical protein